MRQYIVDIGNYFKRKINAQADSIFKIVRLYFENGGASAEDVEVLAKVLLVEEGEEGFWG